MEALKSLVLKRVFFAVLAIMAAIFTAAAAEVSDAPGPEAAKPQPPSAEQIAAWIAQLDDNRYLEREQATQQLLEADATAFDPLLAAANGEKPEPADRAVWILRQFGNSTEAGLRRQALERLVQLRRRPQVAGAARDALAEIHHEEAVAAIEQLGGRYVDGGQPALQYGPLITPRVELDRQWRGGDEGVVHFRNLIAARQVVIIGADISAKGVTELQHVPHLEDLLLYGTKLTEADLPQIKYALPHVAIDYRRGGLLGVAGSPADDTGPALVSAVQPGTAAAEAGIQVGDIIKTFQGDDVQNFKALTKMIGKHAEGDEVTLQVLRGGQTIDFKVKLGEWKTLN